MTSLIRLRVPSSTPFISETSNASDGIRSTQSVRFSRKVCDGVTAKTRLGAVERLGRVVGRADSASGSSMPGR